MDRRKGRKLAKKAWRWPNGYANWRAVRAALKKCGIKDAYHHLQ